MRSAPPSAASPANCCGACCRSGPRVPPCTQVLGKHYPGEQLPRWALNAHWRRDGETGLARPGPAGRRPRRERRPATDDAERFCAALAERLQVSPGYINPAYEDIHWFLWKEGRLPANVLAEGSKLKDPLARDRLAAGVRPGSGNRDVGSVLPLRRRGTNGGPALAVRQMVFQGRHHVPDPGRRAARLSPAARQPALGRPATIIEFDQPSRSVRVARPAAAARRRSCRHAGAANHGDPPASAARNPAMLRHRAAAPAGDRARGAGSGAHRARRRAAPRQAARVLPAALHRRGLARSGRGRRGRRPRNSARRWCWKATRRRATRG